MATITFEQIVDSRFGETLELLQEKCSAIATQLATMPVVVWQSKPRKCVFSSENSVQWRVRFHVRKGRTPGCTWDDVYKAVNDNGVRAPYYQRV